LSFRVFLPVFIGYVLSINNNKRDWTLVHLMTKKLIPSLVLCPSQLQVAHIGLDGMHGEGKGLDKKVAGRIRNVDQLERFTGTTFRDKSVGRAHTHYKGYGGWGHPADHAHCLSLFEPSTDNQNKNGMASRVKHLLGLSGAA
jgi:hypothetical protein